MSQINIACSNIIVQDQKILFVRESKSIAKDKFSLPAGKLEFGESILDGAIREAKEETGLDVEPIKLIGIYQRPASKENTNTTFFCFLSIIKSGEIKTSAEHPEVKYLSINEIHDLNQQDRIRCRYTIPAINDYLNHQGIDTEFINIIK